MILMICGVNNKWLLFFDWLC